MNRVVGTIIGVLLVAFSFLAGRAVGLEEGRKRNPHLLLNETEQVIMRSAIQRVSREKLIRGAVIGMLESLHDPYAAYLDPESYASLRETTSGYLSGVGILIREGPGGPVVVSVVPGTSAAEAGLLAGDVVTLIDDVSSRGLSVDDVLHLIRGPMGTTVEITISREGNPVELLLERRRIEIPAVEWQAQERLGIIRVFAFTRGSAKQVRDAVRLLGQQHVLGFILDLRGNQGGLLPEAVEVASVFLDGEIVTYKQRGRSSFTYKSLWPVETTLPVVLLVDAGSASGAEIVAAAIQDRGRGLIVGTRTFGKGSVQSVIPLTDGSAIKLTTAQYEMPSGRVIAERGIVPNVQVALPTAQLNEAKSLLLQSIQERKQTPK